MMHQAVLVVSVLLVSACDARVSGDTAHTPAGSVSATRFAGVLEDDGRGEFSYARAPRSFAFPADHGPHPEFRHEWWYVTGNLEAPDAARFGFEMTFFRLALAAPAIAENGASKWRTRQMYAAHFAITDVERGAFHFGERFSRDALGLAGAGGSPLRVWLNGWSLELADEHDLPWRLVARDGPYALDLELRPTLAPVLNGAAGLSRKSAQTDAASYYYSIPRLSVSGHIQRERESFEVSGTAWFDREWGSDALAPGQEGWDWFALQLNDGSALMFYALRRRDGSRDPQSAGTWIDSEGTQRLLSTDDVLIEVDDRWQSPRGGKYPARWQLRVPDLDLKLDIRPVLADQELNTTPRYWEGAVDVGGTRAGVSLTGRGYVELTGYARRTLNAGLRAMPPLRATLSPSRDRMPLRLHTGHR